ncbi:Kef-type K+ transport system membrane component KefB [Bradyrhizobium sp. CIR18]|nr:Kef-type K+ transport system membrane component KefB [Bradyrhizobium sp. CIR18]
MKEPQWYDVLEPREAVFAGFVEFAIVCPLVCYASYVGYVFWGYSPREWKNLGTALVVLSFAVPYVLMRWVVRRR